ncbi:uncharacterized protein LOC133831392 [Humulus lupulus]|uniref:uncharacterized protein LOC133831392 n=1 Tax=Humulus lupulus TaxID=3486 RepID=UPI002B411999|nr:uncharacterized protein LOC133831392 [Humulus lupulus]
MLDLTDRHQARLERKDHGKKSICFVILIMGLKQLCHTVLDCFSVHVVLVTQFQETEELFLAYMRSFVPAVYDVTVAIPKTSPPPTIMLRLFKGQPSVVHVHIKRHVMKDLPESDDAVAQWCKDVFTILMQFLILFSQSERSTPAKVP